MVKELYPYQKFGAEWLSQKETAMLADAPGCGKTGQAIVGADISRSDKILVLTPGVARLSWVREFAEFSKFKRTISYVKSSKEGIKDTSVIVASYSIVRSRPILEKLLSMEFDLLICDEAHFLKSTSAVITKCVYGAKFDRAKGLASRAKKVWLLTGTPMNGSLMDMYTHSRALFPDVFKGLERASAWKDHFCITDSFGDRVVANKNVKEFVQKIRPYVLRRKLEDVLPEIPAIRFSQVVVDPEKLPTMSEIDLEASNIIKNAMAQRIANAGAGHTLSLEDLKAIESVAGMHIATNRKWCGVAKAKAVADVVKMDFESGMDKVVIFALHKDVFSILLKEIPGSAAIHGSVKMEERDRLIDRFQGKIPNEPLNCLIVHLGIGSTAITLTASCNVIFAEIDWVPASIQQAAKRCHRFGQTRPVLARIISLRDSIDEAVGNVVTRKSQSILKIENALTSSQGI